MLKILYCIVGIVFFRVVVRAFALRRLARLHLPKARTTTAVSLRFFLFFFFSSFYVKLKNEAQPEEVVPEAGRVAVTKGGPAVAGVVVPAAATEHAVRA